MNDAGPKVFKKVDPGEWQTPVMRGYRMKCCDCGLVHEIDFRVLRMIRRYKGGWSRAAVQGAAYAVQMRAYRAPTSEQ